MKITGIVVEYNPFHNGHLFQIQKARELTACDFLIVVMSGNFAQRGIPCIVDKFTRTHMALACGVDMVLELPVPFATASAERFCEGAISTLNKTGIVDTLCFGSESDNLPLMNTLAKLMIKEPLEVSEAIQHGLKQGLSYPRAKVAAISTYLSRHTHYESSFIESALIQPNNILGTEYIKALLKYNSSITPFTIKRVTAGYHDQEISHAIASATAIRKAFSEQKQHLVELAMPPEAYEELFASHKNPLPNLDQLTQSLLYKFIFSDMNDLYTTWDVPKHLCHSIWNAAKTSTSISEIIDTVTSKTYSRATVQRTILRILLDLKEESIAPLESIDWIPYIRVLGCRQKSLSLLSHLSNSAKVPIITNPHKALNTLDHNGQMLLRHEIKASHLYALASSQSVYQLHDFTKGLIIKNT